jgi:hypothetical protein
MIVLKEHVPHIYKEIAKLLLGVIILAGVVWLVVVLGGSLY